jgi:threonylcarbamoyladenosine tRNA methylthiotransferase MtaB
VEHILEQARQLGDSGAREIVLTGVNIGDFGNGTDVIEGVRPHKNALFLELIRALDEVQSVARFRISSIEPNLCTPEIIEWVASSQRFMPHFHMPLQSGSDRILGLMRRRYRRDLYADRVALIKQTMPHACIGVDVIAGFPGEREEDFRETLDFLQALPVSYLHVFTYSERANTPAAVMAHPVPLALRRERNEQLRMLSEKKRRAFYEEHLGSERPALLENGKSNALWQGFTDNYIEVSLPADQGQLNQILAVRLKNIHSQGHCTATTLYRNTLHPTLQ